MPLKEIKLLREKNKDFDHIHYYILNYNINECILSVKHGFFVLFIIWLIVKILGVK
jgi:hypothetical protein